MSVKVVYTTNSLKTDTAASGKIFLFVILLNRDHLLVRTSQYILQWRKVFRWRK